MMEPKSKPLKKKKNSVIDLEPTLNTTESGQKGMAGTQLTEMTITTTQADWLINHGLGQKDKLIFYRRALQDPKGSIQNPQYRAYVGEVAERIFGLIWGDNQMYQRLKTLLQEKYHGHVDTGTYVIGEGDDNPRDEDEDEDDDKKDDEEEDTKTEAVSMLRLRSILNKKVSNV